MRDSIKPVIVIRNSDYTQAKVQKTNVAIYDQGITYNEAGLTYNEAGYAYGGLYGQDSVQMSAIVRYDKPMIASMQDFSSVHPLPPGANAKIPMGPGFFMFIPYT